jgi:hypothetical protein
MSDSIHFVSDVLAGVDDEDRENIKTFALYLENWVHDHGLNERYNIFTLLDTFRVYDLTTLNKEGSCLQALWVIFLRIMRKNLIDDSLFKYKCMPDFLQEYNGEFDKVDSAEQVKLFHTANWMQILFKMVPAKKNKGLAIHVIPKLVEGFSVKYITGSGQTKATADRVQIFEHEGNVKPFQRGKWKNSDDIRGEGGAGSGAENKRSKKDRSAYDPAPFKRMRGDHRGSLDAKDAVPALLESMSRDRSIDSGDFADCLKLLRNNSQTNVKTSLELQAADSGFERHKSIDSVDFAECLKLLRTNSYTKPPDLNRDWSNSSLGFLTDSLLQPLSSDSYPSFFFDRSDSNNDGLSLLNEAALGVTSLNHTSSIDFALLGEGNGSIDLSSFNQLASNNQIGPPPMKRSSSISSSWKANNNNSSEGSNGLSPAQGGNPI